MLSAGNMLITGGTDVIMSAANDWTVLSDHFYLTSNGRGTVQSSGNLLLAATDGTADINIEASDDVNITCDVFRINGAGKTAVLDTSKGYRELYCMESPEVWFMDFCDTKDSVDPLFLEVTEAPYRFIKCDPDGFQVWGKRKGFSSKRFEQVSKLDYITNNKFWSSARPRKRIE